MRQSEIIVGGRYSAKVSGRVVIVRVTSIATSQRTGRKTFSVVNETTGRTVNFRSAQRFRLAVKDS